MNLLCGIVRFDGGAVAAEELAPMLAAADLAEPADVEQRSASGARFAMGRVNGGGPASLDAVSGEGLWLRTGSAAVPEGSDEKAAAPFASAHWDEAARRLVLNHDFFARRGLYWRRAKDRFYFASEPCQLVAVPGPVAARVDRRRLLAYLTGAAPRPEESFFDGIRRLPEAASLEVDGTTESLRPEDFPVADRLKDEAVALRERLERAVVACLPSDGPAAVLLSGGLDSSAVAALLVRHSSRPFAVSWRGGGLSEGASDPSWGGALRAEAVAADDLWPLSCYPEAFDDPNAPLENTYPGLLRATLEHLRRLGAKVLLNGLGGDPIAGWPMPDLALLLRARWGALLSRWRRAGWRRAGWRAMLLLRQLRATLRRRLPGWLSEAAKSEARDWGLDRSPIAASDLLSARRFRQAQLRSAANPMMAERLERLGRRSGVRIEAPWLDRALVAWSLAARDCSLEVHPPAKRLVRTAFDGLIPDEVLTAPSAKAAGPSLVRRGLLEKGRDKVENLLTESRLEGLGLVQSSRVLREYRARADRGSVLPGLWRILTAEAWLRTAPVSS
ncbi:MAG: asparagine synthase-related protein [Acidobacteriota bacterium]